MYINKKYAKYLPSKKFTKIFISCVVVVLVFFLISNIFFSKTSFLSLNKKSQNSLETKNITLHSLVIKDTDGDGVADWEESLWGTDPNKIATFDNIPDKEYIKNKRDALKLPGDSGVDNTGLSETEKFAQQFFASLAALKQSGQFDSNTIKNMSTTLGENIANPTIIDAYSQNNIKISSDDSTQNQENYYIKAGNLFETYKNKGVGDELDSVSTIAAIGSSGSNPDLENKLNNIANYYQEYAQKMLTISVPESLSSYHLRIINDSNNTGISVRNMAKISIDPIIGLSGVAQYQKYSEDLIKSVTDLEAVLTTNGIIE